MVGEAPFLPNVRTVPEAIAWWARETPDAPALLGLSGDVVAYGALQHRLDLVARRLRALGAGRRERVMLALPDGVAAAVAGLATAGVAIAAPVNPGHVAGDAEAVVRAMRPAALMVLAGEITAYREVGAAAGIPVLEVDARGVPVGAATDAAADDGSWRDPPHPEDLALILLTSGTTERPRRVPVSHGNLLSTCAARVTFRRLGRHDRGLSSAPAYFVLGLGRVAESLLGGGSAIVASSWEILHRPERVAALGPTWAWLSPAFLEALLERVGDPASIREWPLRFLRVGGAQVTPEQIARCEALVGVPLLNGYGTTETLGYIAAEESPETVPRKPGSVGQGRPDLQIVIRDEAGAVLPIGDVGEITVRGESVFPGYLDDPEATAAVFYPGGWYRTGDLGYLDGDGYLFVTGRAREMINRGGEKIAPHEIDEVVRAHPAVADAAAFGLPEPRLGEEVAVAVVLREGAHLSPRALRRWLAGRLALHMLPRRIWFVDALPRTGSGKIQRGLLRESVRA